MSVKKGQKIKVMDHYSAAGFGIDGGEDIAPAYDAFQRDGRDRTLVPLAEGDSFEALTDASDSGVYVRVEKDGKSYAVRLLDGTFSP